MHYSPKRSKAAQKKMKPTNNEWFLDETYVKVKGKWKYLYRAVDSKGNTLDFLLTAKRDKQAALKFLNKTLGSQGKPERITIDKSGANTAAIKALNEELGSTIEIRQNK